jgi:hypothetical protein
MNAPRSNIEAVARDICLLESTVEVLEKLPDLAFEVTSQRLARVIHRCGLPSEPYTPPPRPAPPSGWSMATCQLALQLDHPLWVDQSPRPFSASSRNCTINAGTVMRNRDSLIMTMSTQVIKTVSKKAIELKISDSADTENVFRAWFVKRRVEDARVKQDILCCTLCSNAR